MIYNCALWRSITGVKSSVLQLFPFTLFSMGNILSRTARIYNNSSVDMKLEVKLEPGCPQPPIFIQAGQYQDLPYRQFCLEDINPNVKVTLLISPAVGKFRERDKQLIMPAEIRDFSEIHIDYKRRKVLVSKVEGPLRRRTRLFRKFNKK